MGGDWGGEAGVQQIEKRNINKTRFTQPAQNWPTAKRTECRKTKERKTEFSYSWSQIIYLFIYCITICHFNFNRKMEGCRTFRKFSLFFLHVSASSMAWQSGREWSRVSHCSRSSSRCSRLTSWQKKRKSKDGEYYFPQNEPFSSRDTHFGVHLDRSLDVPGRPLGGVVVAKLDLHQEVRRLRVLQKNPRIRISPLLT